MKFSKVVANHHSGKRRATAIEYALVAACIAVAIIAVVQSVSTKLTSTPSKPAIETKK